jgi:hypothetical protein
MSVGAINMMDVIGRRQHAIQGTEDSRHTSTLTKCLSWMHQKERQQMNRLSANHKTSRYQKKILQIRSSTSMTKSLVVSRRRYRSGEMLSSNDDGSTEPQSKRTRYQSTHLGKSTHETQTSLEELAPDVFCNVLDFLGAASKSLVRLSLVNKRFRKIMLTIGDFMLPRALLHFRQPLPPKSAIESSTSLFIRHARICSRVLSDLEHLRHVLGTAPDTIQGNDVRKALNMAVDLLDVAPAFSDSLQRQILATCGKCGGKAFKHSKLLLRAGDSRVGSSSLRYHEEILETSRLIMQTVVFRELQLSKRNLTSLQCFVQNETGGKQIQKTGCL